MMDDIMPTDKMPKIYLSERNLRILLSKLQRDAAGDTTACSIVKHQQPNQAAYNQTMKSIMVIAVQDAEYYGAQGRSAGEMHPLDEVSIADNPAEEHRETWWL
jgi:hypothetical protein